MLQEASISIPTARIARVPDFFVAGAPKCGTTSLYRYLSTNVHVFLSAEKEPRHFCSDLPFRNVKDRSAYLRLFEAAPLGVPAGEASPWYLYSRTAVPAILRLNPKAKFVVLVRNPVDLAASLYQHHRRAGIEPAATFEAAWRDQDERYLGELWRDILVAAAPGANGLSGRGAGPVLPRFPYRDVCRLGAQVERLLGLVPRERVLVLLLDDLALDPKGSVKAVCAFLGVPAAMPSGFAVHNAARTNRSKVLTRLWYAATRRTPLYWWTKRALNRLGLRPGRFLFDRIITKETGRLRLPPALAEAMRQDFQNDVTLLAGLTGRNLGAWIEGGR